MSKAGLIFLTLFIALYLAGCGKKQQSLEEMQQPMSVEDLSRLSTETQGQAAESKPEVTQLPQDQAQVEPLPPAGPYKPTAQEIQTALKNAGFYAGSIDGKIGSLTKKAITEFQKTKGLQADGKVGPKTWAILGNYLNPAPTTQAAPVTKKKR